MPAFAGIALDDGQTTPVTTTFTPNRIDQKGVALWRDNTATVFDSARALTESITLPANGSAVTRVRFKIVVPVMDPSDSSKKIGECLANLEFVVPKVSTLQDRKDLRAYCRNLTAADEFIKAVTLTEMVY